MLIAKFMMIRRRLFIFHPLPLISYRTALIVVFFLLKEYFFIHLDAQNVLNFLRQFLFMIFSFLMLPFQLKRKTKDGRNIFLLSLALKENVLKNFSSSSSFAIRREFEHIE